MADNFDDKDKKRNIRKVHYEPQVIPPDIISQISYYEEAARELRRRAGMFSSIYIPADHPAVSNGLLLRGLRLLWIDKQQTKSRRMYGIIEDFESIKSEIMEKELPYLIRKEMDYDGRRYIRVKLLMEREETIVFVTGRTIDILLTEMNGNVG